MSKSSVSETAPQQKYSDAEIEATASLIEEWSNWTYGIPPLDHTKAAAMIRQLLSSNARLREALAPFVSDWKRAVDLDPGIGGFYRTHQLTVNATVDQLEFARTAMCQETE